MSLFNILISYALEHFGLTDSMQYLPFVRFLMVDFLVKGAVLLFKHFIVVTMKNQGKLWWN